MQLPFVYKCVCKSVFTVIHAYEFIAEVRLVFFHDNHVSDVDYKVQYSSNCACCIEMHVAFLCNIHKVFCYFYVLVIYLLRRTSLFGMYFTIKRPLYKSTMSC